ncbi:hypothetical protein Taro_019853 [Colocasia esculenta]|uniref:AAA+ ATPase domain-containing protein n=1 Tax=Colocasia esculenta TaxID=4460 RepID=A0A843UUN2_COLES|nr:hypothetical protein [Colocasia esculenta]
MSDGRRHSVDIPLSKTLVALKRVRSLRDPSTNSMIKFPAFDENPSWETNSSNEPILELRSYEDNTQSKIHHFRSDGRREEYCSDSESAKSFRVHGPKHNTAITSSKQRVGGSESIRTKQIRESRGQHHHRKFDSTWVPNASDLFEEEVDSYSEPTLELTGQVNARALIGHRNLRKPTVAESVDRSCIGSPCLSPSEPHTNVSSHSTLGFANEEADVMHSNQNGCGLGNCWSRTPKYQDPSHFSNGENQCHPLLSTEGRENTYREMTPSLESPRCLSQKFRPRSFAELVGQHVVVQSLVNAISKGKIAPVYLFHGPRGTGKTSMARVFAAALNCLSFGEQTPCGFCRECIFFFSGRSRDIKELDSAKLNCKDRVKALLKSASLLPFSSQYKIFIIDECQFLRRETWDSILKNLMEFSRHVVFIMITSDLDKLQHSSLSRCQRYHFLKIKDEDIVCRLQKICIEEALDFDNDALSFIAARSNGSLRDAETTLDQLSLLGKRINLSLAYELIGVAADDELLDLLDLALSSDTSNTVRRARELMSSRVDPMQLVSQLANLIMDILAGRCQSGNSEIGRNFFGRHTLAEAGLKKLRHALKILSETEKQLRTSKNQATWLTVALLQFHTGEFSSPMDIDDPTALMQPSYLKDGVLCRTLSTRESLKSSVCCDCNHNKSSCFERACSATNKLETIWSSAIEICQPDSLRSFLKKGKLSSIYVKQGLTIAEVEFCSPDHVSRAEKSWKLIASSLQHVLGHNVEIRINLVRCSSLARVTKVKELTFRLLSCSGKKQHMSDSTRKDENETEMSSRKETFGELYSPNKHLQSLHVQQMDSNKSSNASYFHDKAVSSRNVDRDALSTDTAASIGSVLDDPGKCCNFDSNNSKGIGEEGQCFSIQESETQPSCFARTMKLQRKLFSSDSSHVVCLRIRRHNKYSYIFCSKSNAHSTHSSGDEDQANAEDPDSQSLGSKSLLL